jgi:putative oxidoreductase
MKSAIKFLNLSARLVAAIILLQTLYFKFTGASESIYIFSTIGMEPWGRWVVGTLELVAGTLLLIPGTAGLGALLAAGLMGGAIGMHLTILGFEVQNDDGYLFFLALTVLAASAIVLWLERASIFAQVRSVLFQRSQKSR